MSATLQQIYTLNPTSVVNDTDLFYLVRSPYTPGSDFGINGADLKTALGVGNVNPGLINQLAWYAASGSTVSGLATANNGVLVTSAGGVPSISSTLPSAVQGNITSLGTISSGTWNGSIISGTYGGTGVNNGASTITVGGNFAMSGAFSFTGTLTGITAVTFPTSGTLATTSQIPTGAALTKTDDTNVTLTLGGSPTTALVNAASLTLGWTGQLSGARGGTGVNNGASTITVGGNFAMSGAFTFTGTLTGNTAVTFPTSGTLATTTGTIANATNIGITDDNATNATMLPVWVTTNTGFLPAKVSSTKITFNPSTATLTTTTFSGALSGNATTATTATNANNVATVQTSTNASFFPLFVASSTNSNQPINLGTGLTFNPSTNTLTTTTFSGALSGNATTATTATNATNVGITNDTTTNATMNLTWVTSNTGNLPVKTTSTKLNFNPSTGTLSTTSLAFASGNGILDSSGNNQLLFNATASAATYFTMTNAVASGAPLLGVAGSGTNVSFNLMAKGAGTFTFFNQTSDTLLTLSSQATPVANYLAITSTSSGSAPALNAAGSDSNITINFFAKGTGIFQFVNNGSSVIGAVSSSGTPVNYFTQLATATGVAPEIQATSGTDSNVNIKLTPKGTGKIQYNNASSFSANNTVATVLGSLGPTGSHTTVQKWLTILDSSGTTLYIPCF